MTEHKILAVQHRNHIRNNKSINIHRIKKNQIYRNYKIIARVRPLFEQNRFSRKIKARFLQIKACEEEKHLEVH